MTRKVACFISVLAVAAIPASAQASITLSDGAGSGEVMVTSDEEGDTLPIAYDQDSFTFTVDAGTSTLCVGPISYPGLTDCPYIGMIFLGVSMGAGDDYAYAYAKGDNPWPEGKLLQMDGGQDEDKLDGGEGNDRLDGGNGDDGRIRGFGGDDRLTGGAGKDGFNGGKGKDKLRAKDGEKDKKLDCGPGSDPNPKADGKDPNPISC